MLARELLVTLPRRVKQHPAFVPVSVFFGLALVLVVSLSLTERSPAVASITPQVGYPGGVMVIHGRSFGSNRGTAEVVIAGVRPARSAYLEWTNRRISVRIPENVDSGMVYVVRGSRTSNGRLFTNKYNIPMVVEQTPAPGQPYIQSITPASGTVGTRITIRGQNFGALQGKGELYFTPVSLTDPSSQGLFVGQRERYAGCACDFPIQSWSDGQIVAYIPDGASSGNVMIVTARGASNSRYLDVSYPVGTKVYKDKRGYQVNYGVQVSDVTSGQGGFINVWVPELSNGLSQRHEERISEPGPPALVSDGLMEFHLANLKDGSTASVSVTYYFDRYAIETQIDPSKVPTGYDTNSELYKVYTAPDAVVPSNNPTIVSDALKAVGSEQNPYRKARLLYNFLLQKLRYTPVSVGTDVPASLTAGTGDSYTYAVAFVALARAVGIPARPVAGYLVYGNKQAARHFWAEFYLEGFGWVPVDPSLGAGASYGGFPSRGGVADYYFGNIDNHHIALTRGLVAVPQGGAESVGKIVTTSSIASLQTIYETASPAVRGYTSNWSGITVVDSW